LIQAIDGWVVRKAITLIAQHARSGRKLALNVNLSGKSIGDRKLAALIEEALAEAGIDPAQLNFELTETAAIANVEEARAFATRLRGRGRGAQSAIELDRLQKDRGPGPRTGADDSDCSASKVTSRERTPACAVRSATARRRSPSEHHRPASLSFSARPSIAPALRA